MCLTYPIDKSQINFMKNPTCCSMSVIKAKKSIKRHGSLSISDKHVQYVVSYYILSKKVAVSIKKTICKMR